MNGSSRDIQAEAGLLASYAIRQQELRSPRGRPGPAKISGARRLPRQCRFRYQYLEKFFKISDFWFKRLQLFEAYRPWSHLADSKANGLIFWDYDLVSSLVFSTTRAAIHITNFRIP